MRALRFVFIILFSLFVMLSCSKKTTETDNTTCKNPKFSPSSGTYNPDQLVSIQCGTEDAEIHYTVDMTEPDLQSPLYTQPLVIPDIFINNSNYCVIKARAYHQVLYSSGTVGATYTVNNENTVASPVITPSGGTSNFNPVEVTISCSTPDVDIRYTIDGSEPNYSSDIYTAAIPLTNSASVKASAFKDGWNSSVVVTESYDLALYQVGYFNTPAVVKDVTIKGNFGYIADGYSGLRIYNISDPSTPVETGFYNTPGSAEGVVVSGDYAYVADGTSGLRIIDVSDPSLPVEAGYVDTPGDAVAVALDGNYAYVAVGSLGIRIINVSNPVNPLEVTHINTGGSVRDVVFRDGFIYVSDYHVGFLIFDVSAPEMPSQAGFYNIPEQTWTLAVSGNYAYLTCYNIYDLITGLRIIDISNPSALAETCFIDDLGYIGSLSVEGNIAYLSEYNYGLKILDVSDPSAPVEIGHYYTNPFYSGAIAVTVDYIYLSYREVGGCEIIFNGIE